MKRDWKKAGRNRHGYEKAAPKGAVDPIKGQQHVKRAPVKTWAEMTEAEREAVLKSLKGGKR